MLLVLFINLPYIVKAWKRLSLWPWRAGQVKFPSRFLRVSFFFFPPYFCTLVLFFYLYSRFLLYFFFFFLTFFTDIFKFTSLNYFSALTTIFLFLHHILKEKKKSTYCHKQREENKNKIRKSKDKKTMGCFYQGTEPRLLSCGNVYYTRRLNWISCTHHLHCQFHVIGAICVAFLYIISKTFPKKQIYTILNKRFFFLIRNPRIFERSNHNMIIP